jgi:hypothetical protein
VLSHLDAGSIALRAVKRTLVTGPATADQPWQRPLGQQRNFVSGILGERCHNQFRAICADIKEVRTTNSKNSAKQEDESSFPPA